MKETIKHKIALQIEQAILDPHENGWNIHLPNVRVIQGECSRMPGAEAGITRAIQQVLIRKAKVLSGELRIAGTPVQHASRKTLQRLRRLVAVISCDEGLVPGWTVRENATLPLKIARISARQSRRLVDSVLSDLGMTGVSGSSVSQLTSSQRVLVSLAQAMVKSPLLVLAEQTWGDGVAEIVEAQLQSLARNGSAVLLEGVAQSRLHEMKVSGS